MLVTNPNQIGLRHDFKAIVFYDRTGREVFELEFERAWLATNAAADFIVVAQQIVREMEAVA